MNLVLIHPDELVDGVATLRGRRAKHVHEVHRAAAGDTLVAGLLGGDAGEATVLETTPDSVRLQFKPIRAPPPPLGIDLLLAVPRPKVLRRVLATAASMGVKRLVLVNAARVEKSYFDSPLATPDEMREAMLLGLEQARDTVLPEVRIEKRFRPFVEDEALVLWSDATRLLAHPGTATRVDETGVTSARPCVVAIGPEGGWVPFETALLEQAGFKPFTLGDRILRVDVAVPSVLAQLDLVRRIAVPDGSGTG